MPLWTSHIIINSIGEPVADTPKLIMNNGKRRNPKALSFSYQKAQAQMKRADQYPTRYEREDPI